MAQSETDLTPSMKQYWDLKAQGGDALLFFRMGDFYELFGDDAVRASQLLEITLTSRDKNKSNPVPMAGVPYHSAQGYIQKLLKAGHKVAIGEQMDDTDATASGKAPKIVRREIVRILTPGIQFDSEGAEANYVATLTRLAKGNEWTLACLDASTGETLVSSPMKLEAAQVELRKHPIRHLLLLHADLDAKAWVADSVLVERLPSNYVSAEKASELLKLHFEVGDLKAFLPSDAATFALGVLVTYVLRSQHQERLPHLKWPEPLHRSSAMILGPQTAQHLDLEDLFVLLNQTRCALGARQLRKWLYAPLGTSSDIQERQKAVQALQFSNLSELGQCYDLERILGRVHTRLASPRDTLALGLTLASLPTLIANLQSQDLNQSLLLIRLRERLGEHAQALAGLSAKITQFQLEPAPLVTREGGIFKTGLNPELDRLVALTQDGQQWLVDLEARERATTGISSLKIRYNRVFGYYIEITQAHLKNVPPHYQRKQTMVGAERFFTEELKKFEEEILTASTKQKSLEQELFSELIAEVQVLTQPIMEIARLIGELDSLKTLSLLAGQSGWCFPTIDDSRELKVVAGRHPVVDQAMALKGRAGQFVPNSVELTPYSCLTLLITGPNMGGKSTVMRQNALIVILGQMGAPVPAKQAHWGVVSSLYTRIGAQDAIALGQSTFMVEMSELAHILHNANERSLIILDEIGRGTSTYDGVSVAWSTLEWICNRIGARTFFATHYHELTHLASELPCLSNAHMAVEASGRSGVEAKLRFLYELKHGPTNDSFGIHVAHLAGLPKQVIKRAWKVLRDLESNPSQASNSAKRKNPAKNADHRTERASNQLSLFDLPS